ncbi:LIV-I protein F [Achromobacter spanius]|uniref:ABC transporter ATP-binding protein n=1 Tax=Achromobacter spanius TaxID=217203 RepID=UPI000C2B536F|nr:ABC transporter ATP-binding protein [Achromobacter spanius]AUA56212.1 ABC transporter ATP-binding protein [Achromobacter spanius]CAB3709849.1 High-affinity branched-chain amino acid transport ATP-binding protein LivF [Achromobacter spanius]SPT39162.1 LIV-I protein F [Achromobacter denitrificans]VEE56234.1 LIV-I protein F [Achromobacter spanius]
MTIYPTAHPATHQSPHPTPSSPLLSLQGVHAHYGKSHILHGIDLSIGRGEVVSLLGRNGAGRSTTLKSIMGLVDVTGGRIAIEGRDITNKRPFEIARAGLGFVPEEREVFANLTVDENLRMGEQAKRDDAPHWTAAQMFDYFPRLKERSNTRAGNLSGGEQQMLTMCRSLLGNPKVMLIDEPTEGLAPKIVEVIADVIRDIHKRGVSVVLVEQKLTIALKVSTRVSVMGHGRIVFEGPPAQLHERQDVVQEWLAV